VFKAHTLLCHSTLGLRVITKKKKLRLISRQSGIGQVKTSLRFVQYYPGTRVASESAD